MSPFTEVDVTIKFTVAHLARAESDDLCMAFLDSVEPAVSQVCKSMNLTKTDVVVKVERPPRDRAR